MKIVSKKTTMITDTAIAGNGDTLSSVLNLTESESRQYIELNVSNYTDGNYVAVVQHSSDGTNWYDLFTSSALTANGQVLELQTVETILFKVRVKIVATAVTTGATVNANLHT